MCLPNIFHAFTERPTYCPAQGHPDEAALRCSREVLRLSTSWKPTSVIPCLADILNNLNHSPGQLNLLLLLLPASSLTPPQCGNGDAPNMSRHFSPPSTTGLLTTFSRADPHVSNLSEPCPSCLLLLESPPHTLLKLSLPSGKTWI